MNESVVWVVRIQSELVRTGPQISFLTEVSITFRIKEAPYSDVKLSLVYKQWSLDIFLDDETVVFVFWLVRVSLSWSNRRVFSVW